MCDSELGLLGDTDLNSSVPLLERLLGHRCSASWAYWPLRHEVICMHSAEQHDSIKDGFKGQSASSELQASHEATCAMAACATSRETVNKNVSRPSSSITVYSPAV